MKEFNNASKLPKGAAPFISYTLLLVDATYAKMYKQAFGRYRLQQGLLRSQHKNIPKPPE